MIQFSAQKLLSLPTAVPLHLYARTYFITKLSTQSAGIYNIRDLQRQTYIASCNETMYTTNLIIFNRFLFYFTMVFTSGAVKMENMSGIIERCIVAGKLKKKKLDLSILQLFLYSFNTIKLRINCQLKKGANLISLSSSKGNGNIIKCVYELIHQP